MKISKLKTKLSIWKFRKFVENPKIENKTNTIPKIAFSTSVEK